MLPILFLSLASSCPVQESPLLIPSREVDEHPVPILHLAADRDGTVLVTASQEGEIHAWSPKKGELLWKLQHDKVAAAVLDVGEECVAYSLPAAVVTMLSLKDGSLVGAVGGPPPSMQEEVTSISCDPDGRWAWVGLGNGVALRLIPKDANSWSTRPQKNEGIASLAQDADAKWLAIGGRDHHIRFVNPQSASTDDRKIFEGHADVVTALAFDPKGSKLVSGDRGGEVRVWSVSSGKSTPIWKAHEGAVQRIAVHPAGKWVATAGADGSIELWSLKDGERVATVRPSGSPPAVGLAFLDKGSLLAAAGGSNTATLWELSGL